MRALRSDREVLVYLRREVHVDSRRQRCAAVVGHLLDPSSNSTCNLVASDTRWKGTGNGQLQELRRELFTCFRLLLHLPDLFRERTLRMQRLPIWTCSRCIRDLLAANC